MGRPEKGRGRNVLYFIRQQTLGKGEQETRKFPNFLYGSKTHASTNVMSIGLD